VTGTVGLILAEEGGSGRGGGLFALILILLVLYLLFRK
jgi:hypothetical protein